MSNFKKMMLALDGWLDSVSDEYVTAFDQWLDEVRAEAWDEGHDAGWASRHEDALIGWVPSDPLESDARNPYRKAQTND